MEHRPWRGRPPFPKGPPDESTIVEGRNPVLEALRGNRPLNRLLVSKDIGRHSHVAEILGLARDAGVVVERVDPRALQRLSPTGRSQGILAMVAPVAYANLEDLLEEARRLGEPLLLAVLDGLQDPQNLGAIIRTVDAAGAHGVVIPERRAVGLTAAVARASAGAVEHVPVARVGNIASTMARLAEARVWTVGVDPGGDRDYTQVDYRQPTAVVIGAEGRGLSRLVKERCDLLASIPMQGKMASLNASVAAALVLYEALRQRRGQYHCAGPTSGSSGSPDS